MELAAHAPFDPVPCLDVLEHHYDPWAMVRALDGAPAPGGALACSTGLELEKTEYAINGGKKRLIDCQSFGTLTRFVAMQFTFRVRKAA